MKTRSNASDFDQLQGELTALSTFSVKHLKDH